MTFGNWEMLEKSLISVETLPCSLVELTPDIFKPDKKIHNS